MPLVACKCSRRQRKFEAERRFLCVYVKAKSGSPLMPGIYEYLRLPLTSRDSHVHVRANIRFRPVARMRDACENWNRKCAQS